MHNDGKPVNSNHNTKYRGILKAIAPVIIVFLLLMAAVQFIMLRSVPESTVQTGEQLSQSTLNTLISHYIISGEDQIEYFYSYGTRSVLEGGTILTDHLLIHYNQSENQKLSVIEMPFDEIASVKPIQYKNIRNARIYRVSAIEAGVWFNIVLSTKNKGDELFIQALKNKLTQSQMKTWI